MSKKYRLYIGTDPPSGGANDFVTDFDSLRDAQNLAECLECDWWHIVDTDTNSIVKAKIAKAS